MSGDLNFLNSLTNIRGLRLINPEGNHFGGVLPNFIANLSTQLQQLVLGENKISGNIPKEIGNLINLIQFIATRNYLTGIIPTSIGKLQNLGELDFGWSRLSGLLHTVHPRQLKSTEREHSYISQELPQYGNSGPQSQQVEW